MQVQDRLDTISNEQLRSFLRLCTFGNMQTNATELTNQEQYHLFRILQRLHKTKDIDIKGLWSIISLTFQNRSGLILMTLFNNSNIKTKEIFAKKKFMKDIQILENNDIDGGKLRKILDVLGIEEQLFMEKFRQAEKQITHAQKIGLCQNNYKKIITLPPQPVFNGGYDSDPETEHFIKMIAIDEQSTLNRRFSVVYQRPFFDQFQFSQQNEQEQTITMKRNIYSNQNKPKIKRKRKAKRPQPKQRKQAMMKKAKNVCADQIKLFSVLRQKQRLKKTYNVINLRQVEPITPKKRHQRAQNRHTSPNQMQSQSENMHNPQEIDLQHNQLQMEQQSHTVQINNRMRRHNDRAICVQSEQENESNLQNYMIDQNQIYNQSIQNLTIKKIDFPCTIEDLRRNKAINQMEMKQFLYQEWIEYLNVLNQKQLRNQIKYLIRSKNNVEFEDIAKILSVLENYTMSKYSMSYLKPLLIYKLTKIISITINQIINILYSTGLSISTLSSSCKSMIILYEQFCKNYSIQKLNNLLFQSMTQIVQFDTSKISRTHSLVQLPRAIQIIKQTTRIKIKQEQSMKQSIMSSIFIFVYVFLSKLSKQVKQPNFQHQLSKLKKQLSTNLLKNIQYKTNILKSICQIYTIYELPISNNEQFQQIVSLFNYINIEQPQKQQFYYLIPNLAREFIKQKISKDDIKFNYKPMITHIMISTQIINKCKNSRKQMPLFLVLLTFSAMMEFYQFHEDMTIKRIIEFVSNSIDIQGNYHEEFNIQLLKLMIKCYVIKQNEKVRAIVKDKSQSIRNYQNIVKRQLQSKSEVMEGLQVLINKFLTAFIKKHQSILIFSQNLSPELAQQKLQKYEKILSLFFQDFITNNQIQNSISHYIFTLTLLFNYIWPLISKPKQWQKENQFLADILRLIIKQFYRVDEVWDNFNRLFQYSFDIEEDEANFFFMCQQQKKKYLNSIRSLITQNKDKLSNQFISLSEMKEPRNKLFYQIQGIITTFSIQSQQNSNKTRQLSYHTRQIKIVRSQTQLSCTTNNLIMHFIKGLLKTLSLYSHSANNNWQFYTKENILDIIFLSLVCGGWDSREQLGELFNILYKIPDFKNFNHLLMRFRVTQGILNNGCYLEQYYQSILRKQKNIQRSMCQKFRTIYIEVVKKLWQQYRQHKLYKQQSILALNMLLTFKFLLNLADPSQDTIKAYKEYFIITDTKFTQNATTLNMLKSIQSKSSALNTFIDVQRFVVEIFWVIEDKNKSQLIDTIRNYLEYIVNISLKVNKDMDRVEHRFDNIKKFIEAVHNQCRKKDVLDNFSLFLTDYLVSYLLRATLIKEQMKFSSTRFFLTLFKNYPQLNEAFMKILKQYHEKIDQIIRSMRSPEFQSCENMQDAILKYILDEFCDFETLHQIISNRINRVKDIHNLYQLKAITNKSISYLSKQNFNNQQLVNKYQQLLVEQENINLQNQRNNQKRIGNYLK